MAELTPPNRNVSLDDLLEANKARFDRIFETRMRESEGLDPAGMPFVAPAPDPLGGTGGEAPRSAQRRIPGGRGAETGIPPSRRPGRTGPRRRTEPPAPANPTRQRAGLPVLPGCTRRHTDPPAPPGARTAAPPRSTPPPRTKRLRVPGVPPPVPPPPPSIRSPST